MLLIFIPHKYYLGVYKITNHILNSDIIVYGTSYMIVTNTGQELIQRDQATTGTTKTIITTTYSAVFILNNMTGNVKGCDKYQIIIKRKMVVDTIPKNELPTQVINIDSITEPIINQGCSNQLLYIFGSQIPAFNVDINSFGLGTVYFKNIPPVPPVPPAPIPEVSCYKKKSKCKEKTKKHCADYD